MFGGEAVAWPGDGRGDLDPSPQWGRCDSLITSFLSFD